MPEQEYSIEVRGSMQGNALLGAQPIANRRAFEFYRWILARGRDEVPDFTVYFTPVSTASFGAFFRLCDVDNNRIEYHPGRIVVTVNKICMIGTDQAMACWEV